MAKLIVTSAITFYAVFLSRTLVHAFPSDQALRPHRGPPNANIVPVTWEGKIVDDGPLVNISGKSLHDIHNKILRTNSAFKSWHRNSSRPTDLTTDAANIYDNHINCFQPNCPLVQLYRVTQGEEYLAGITGTCYLQPGATYYNSNCGRVSCSWDTAIYFCQQSNTRTQAVPCSVLGTDYAFSIDRRCRTDDLVQGEKFNEDDGFSVWVGADRC